MEQISFEYLYEAADFLKKEQAAFQLLKPALEETLAKNNLAPKSIFFREGSAEKSLYSSVYLFNEGCIFCRICFRGKQHYLSISSKYEELIPEGVAYKILSSDPSYCRISLGSAEEVSQYEAILCEILAAQIDAFPVEFGCCSRYEACSDAMKCIHPDSDMAIKCAYRKNLKKGRIFYGKNKNI